MVNYSSTFASKLVLGLITEVKREDRCKSGAIPVAVRSPSNFSERKERERKIVEHIPLSRFKPDGKVSNNASSQKTCQLHI